MLMQISRQHISFCDVDAALKALEQFCFLLLLPSSGERHFFFFLLLFFLLAEGSLVGTGERG